MKWQENKEKVQGAALEMGYSEHHKLLLKMLLDGYRLFGIENQSVLFERIKMQFPRMGRMDVQVGLYFDVGRKEIELFRNSSTGSLWKRIQRENKLT